MDPNVVSAQDYKTLQAIASKGDLNPVQKTQYATSKSYYDANPNALGGDGGSNSGMAGAPAIPNLESIYTNSYTNNPLVKASQDKITSLQKDLTEKQKARDIAIRNENDNPFYAEATRVGKISKITDAYRNDENTLTSQIGTEQNTINSAQAEAQRQVNIAQGQYSLDNQAYQTKLSQFNTLLSSGAFANIDPSQIPNLATEIGIPVSVLQSLQKAQQLKEVSPYITTSTDNAGNLSIVTVDKNTGSIINTEQVGGVGKAKTGSSSSKEPTVTKQVQNQFIQDATTVKPIKSAGGLTVGQYPQLVAKYAPVMSLQQINQLYATTDLFKQYGAPKENPTQIQNLYNAAKGKEVIP